MQKSKCKIKEIIAAMRQFHNFGVYSFEFSLIACLPSIRNQIKKADPVGIGLLKEGDNVFFQF